MPDLDLEERLRSELHTALGAGPRVSDGWDDVEARLRPAVARRRRRVALAVAAVDRRRDRGGVGGGDPLGRRACPHRTGRAGTDRRVDRHDRGDGHARRASLATACPVASPHAMLARPTGSGTSSAGARTLVHIDASGRTVGTSTLAPYADSHSGQYSGPVHLASGEGSIWVLFWVTGTLLRVDPATMVVTGRCGPRRPGSGLRGRGCRRRARARVGHRVLRPAGPNERRPPLDPSTMKIHGEIGVPGQGESQSGRGRTAGRVRDRRGLRQGGGGRPERTRILRQIPVAGWRGTGGGR